MSTLCRCNGCGEVVTWQIAAKDAWAEISMAFRGKSATPIEGIDVCPPCIERFKAQYEPE